MDAIRNPRRRRQIMFYATSRAHLNGESIVDTPMRTLQGASNQQPSARIHACLSWLRCVQSLRFGAAADACQVGAKAHFHHTYGLLLKLPTAAACATLKYASCRMLTGYRKGYMSIA